MLTFQKRISNVIEDDEIPIDLAVNLDQAPSSCLWEIHIQSFEYQKITH